MKKIRIIFVLLLIFMGTILVSPINVHAEKKCYYCPDLGDYRWMDPDDYEWTDKNCDNGRLMSGINSEEVCFGLGSESDFIGNLTCGETSFEFHENLPNFTSTLYSILKFGTPVIIVITGMLDMLKAVSAQKEDEIKKSQQKFLRRLLAGAIVFLVFFIVEAVINFVVDSTESKNALDCVNCFLKGADECGTNKKICCIVSNKLDWTKIEECNKLNGSNANISKEQCNNNNVCCQTADGEKWINRGECLTTSGGKILHNDHYSCNVSESKVWGCCTIKSDRDVIKKWTTKEECGGANFHFNENMPQNKCK